MDVIIQKAAPEDTEEILAFLKQVGGETDNLTFGGEGLPFTPEAEAAYLRQKENSSDNFMLVAKVKGKIVGDASLNRLPRRMKHRGEVGVSVLREYWGEGIGSQLLSEIIKLAKEQSFEIVDLQVRSDNLQAIHLYEKYGFQKIGQHPVFFKIGNEEIAFDYMFLKVK